MMMPCFKQRTDKKRKEADLDCLLHRKSIEYRIRLLKYIKNARAGHTGGSLSCVDILNVLYNCVLNVSPETADDPRRDRYIQSKGHSVEALYVVLADRGFFPESDLETLCRFRSPYVGHPTRKIRGIEHNTGALGHGLAFGAGAALAGKMDGLGYRVFVLLGDGELAEGSNWESMMTAAHYGLDNLTAIVDRNQLQITGRTEEVCALESLVDKFAAFGWSVREVDGHDVTALRKVLSSVPFEVGRPSVVIAHTVKGKGVSFMENDAKWHHGVPSDEEYERAMEELRAQLEEAEP
ncbi:MAG TPA: transketolase [Anaerohalosphaeraceae bacterium]|nr:transketolase [Anaerohalosphaeraceae bacterium]HOL88399.1 transketolase [Anaerohalosphaeraceae bacterium]HPP55051.1 transketolase [Anaerohalosphaeraceae bacterium]